MSQVASRSWTEARANWLNRKLKKRITGWIALAGFIDPKETYTKNTAKDAIKNFFGVLGKDERKKQRKKKFLSDHAFYKSNEWRAVRYQALKKHGACCQCCGRSRKHGIVIHVDHIKPRSNYPELELNIDNLQVLCEDCNLGKMARDEIDWR